MLTLLELGIHIVFRVQFRLCPVVKSEKELRGKEKVTGNQA